MQAHSHDTPEFVPYPHLRIRTKVPIFWGFSVKVCMMWTSLWFLYRHRIKCWGLHFVKHPNNIGYDMNHFQIALSFFHSHGHGVMGITPSSTTLIQTLCPLVTRDLTTEQDAPCGLNCPSPQMPINTDGQAFKILPEINSFHLNCVYDWLRKVPKYKCLDYFKYLFNSI